MANFWEAPTQPSLYGYRPNASIRDLILMGGQERAQAAQRSGEIWANTLGNVGQQIGQGIQAYSEQKQMAKRDAATVALAQNWNGQDANELYTGLLKIGGAAYAEKHAPAIMAFHSKPSEDPKTELQNIYAAGKGLADPTTSPEMKEIGWDGFRNRFGDVLVRRGIVTKEMLQGPWTPEHEKIVGNVVNSFGDLLNIKPEAAAKIEHVDLGDAIGVLDAKGNLVSKIPKGIVPKEEKPPTAELRDLGGTLGVFDQQGNLLRKEPKTAAPHQPDISGTDEDAEAIADAIIRGDQPPDLKALYRMGGPVKAVLAKKGFNLAGAQTDWNATQKHLATLNGPAQTRMAQAIETSSHALDVIDDLAAQWKGGKFPVLNKAQLGAAKNGLLGQDAQRIANQLEAQITDVTSELGQVYMGGNSPTDHALALAGKNLAADWSETTLKSMTDLARKNLQIRSNSMKNSGVLGASAGNPYAVPAAAEPAQAAAPPTISSQAQFDALPSGAKFIDARDGKKYTKK